MPAAVFHLYRPLFRPMPGATYRYLSLWGVSEIQVFFITDAPQNVPEPQSGTSNNE